MIEEILSQYLNYSPPLTEEEAELYNRINNMYYLLVREISTYIKHIENDLRSTQDEELIWYKRFKQIQEPGDYYKKFVEQRLIAIREIIEAEVNGHFDDFATHFARHSLEAVAHDLNSTNKTHKDTVQQSDLEEGCFNIIVINLINLGISLRLKRDGSNNLLSA